MSIKVQSNSWCAVKYIAIMLVAVSIAACNLSSSGPHPVPTPPQNSGSISGHITIPSGAGISSKDITIGAGVNGTFTPDSSGNYQVKINAKAPVLAVAVSPDNSPMLMNLFDSTAGTNDLDANTTAATLVFIGLSLYTESSTTWRTLLSTISNVPEVHTLASLISEKLSSNPDILSVDPPDQAIANASDTAMVASMIAIRSAHTLAVKNVAKGLAGNSIIPESQCGLSIAVNSNRQAIATNSMLRYVTATVDGPRSNGIRTLVGPCSPPIMWYQPKQTILNPNPLPAPSAGATDTYIVRARGGFNNTNGLYNDNVDKLYLLEAWEYTALANFTMPLISMILGTSLDSLIKSEVFDSIKDLLLTPLGVFGANLLDQIRNQDIHMGKLVAGLLSDIVSQWIQNWPYWTEVFAVALAVELPQLAAANVVPGLNIALRIMSVVVNGSEMAMTAYAWYSTDMVDVYTINISSPAYDLTMIHVPGGTFQRDETASNTTMVSPFYMSTYEITQGQYVATTGKANPSGFSGGAEAPNRPVETVSWYDALVFCNMLSISEGRIPVYTIGGSTNPADWGTVPTSINATWDGAIMNMAANGYRLPTEAEWMWAAMGATSGAGYPGSGTYTSGYQKEFAGDPNPNLTGNSIGGYAWAGTNSSGTTHPVGTKLPNELDLYDMSGNVFEWTWDWLDAYPSGAQIDPTGPISGTARVAHGGSWLTTNDTFYCALSYRANPSPYGRGGNCGFRVVRR